MKKTYVKPIIAFESFTLSAAVAADCEKSAPPVLYDCGIEFSMSTTIFVTGASGCDLQVEDQVKDGYCYHVPNGENLFNS